jgi:hypothetical protein
MIPPIYNDDGSEVVEASMCWGLRSNFVVTIRC